MYLKNIHYCRKYTSFNWVITLKYSWFYEKLVETLLLVVIFTDWVMGFWQNQLALWKSAFRNHLPVPSEALISGE